MVLDVCSNNLLFRVPLVASIPIMLLLVFRAAGFIAGSIPIKGMEYFSLKISIALVVAVLQATIIILQFLFSKISVFFILMLLIAFFNNF